MKPLAPERVQRDVGRRIAELRAEHALTQEQLAEKLAAPARWIQSVESGAENLTIATLTRFANALKVPMVEFLKPPTRPRARPGRPRSAKPKTS